MKKQKKNQYTLVLNFVTDFATDYRLSFKCNGQPKYWHQQDFLDIDLLTEHTETRATYVLPF